MKKLFFLLAFPLTFQSCEILNQVAGPLTSGDVSSGLKQALNIGIDLAGNTLNSPSQFGGNTLLNAILPSNVTNILNTARQLGFGNVVDNLTSKLGEAAANTVTASIPIFKNAISNMSFNDAFAILKGGNGAGTNFLKQAAGAAIIAAIQPQVNQVFSSIGIKPNLLQNFGAGNNPLLGGLNLDLTNGISTLVSDKIFETVATEENKIRNNFSARTTPLLQRVFGS